MRKYLFYLCCWSVSVGIASAQTRLQNPIPSVGGLNQFILLLITIMQWVLTPIFVVLLVFAGYMLVTAQGDEKKLQIGKQAIVWSIVGGLIIFGAQVIATAIKGTLDPFLAI
jgi:hypothetical protein